MMIFSVLRVYGGMTGIFIEFHPFGADIIVICGEWKPGLEMKSWIRKHKVSFGYTLSRPDRPASKGYESELLSKRSFGPGTSV